MKPSPDPDDVFGSDLHRAWKADREVRHRVPLTEAWRGCLGLAVLLDRPDDTEAHGRLALVRNEQLTWVAVRDVPVGHFPGSPSMDRRDVNYVNTTTATLRHGRPVIDFTAGDLRGAVDFKRIPFAPHLRRIGPKAWDQELVEPLPGTLDARDQRMFGVLNAISAAMTTFAFTAADETGRPCRRPWVAVRPPDCGPLE